MSHLEGRGMASLRSFPHVQQRWFQVDPTQTHHKAEHDGGSTSGTAYLKTEKNVPQHPPEERSETQPWRHQFWWIKKVRGCCRHQSGYSPAAHGADSPCEAAVSLQPMEVHSGPAACVVPLLGLVDAQRKLWPHGKQVSGRSCGPMGDPHPMKSILSLFLSSVVIKAFLFNDII